ncbi:rOK family protein [Roseburia sp. CAG:303]|nr:rOK family protein [Roseburia sp. CAG:303]
MYKFGVDVGGTTVKIGLFSGDGKLEEKYEIATDKSDQGAHIIEHIAAKLDEIIAEKSYGILDCMGVGIGLPGPVDRGMILGCVNLGWGIFSIVEEFSKAFHNVPVYAGNDANTAALGEYVAGAGKGMKNMMMVTLGTGVGGGIIIDGRILEGANGGAGEIGHIPVNPQEQDICGCGKKGCLEQYASATGIVRVAEKLRKENGNTALPAGCTAKQVFDYAKEGDELAMQAVEELGRYLGLALASCACVLNPEGIVIGGGVSRAGKILLDVTEKNFQTYVFKPCRNVKFCLAELGNDAGIYGAAAMVN